MASEGLRGELNVEFPSRDTEANKDPVCGGKYSSTSEDLCPSGMGRGLLDQRRGRSILRTSALRCSKKFATHKQLQDTAKITHLGDTLMLRLLET
jgi:hypothetical protein